MNYYKSLFVCFFCLVTSTSVFAVERVDPLKSFLNDFNSLQANFSQSLLNENGEEIEKTSGTLYLQQPGKFNWSYKNPYIQTIISNGKVLWIYDEDLEQLTIRELDNNVFNKTPAAIILGDSILEKHFTQTDLGNIEGFEWVELIPRDVEAQYKNIRLGFDRRRLGMMIIADNLGQTTRIDFSDVNKNATLSPELFNFVVPAGVDVIDERSINQAEPE